MFPSLGSRACKSATIRRIYLGPQRCFLAPTVKDQLPTWKVWICLQKSHQRSTWSIATLVRAVKFPIRVQPNRKWRFRRSTRFKTNCRPPSRCQTLLIPNRLKWNPTSAPKWPTEPTPQSNQLVWMPGLMNSSTTRKGQDQSSVVSNSTWVESSNFQLKIKFRWLQGSEIAPKTTKIITERSSKRN